MKAYLDPSASLYTITIIIIILLCIVSIFLSVFISLKHRRNNAIKTIDTQKLNKVKVYQELLKEGIITNEEYHNKLHELGITQLSLDSQERGWICPYCGFFNPNTSSICQNCNSRL